MTSFTRKAAALVALVALASCGGSGSGGGPVPAAQPTSGGDTQTIAVSITIPGASSGASHGSRHPEYISRNTKGIGFNFGPHPKTFTQSLSALRSPRVAIAIAPGINGCGTAASDGSYTCSLSVPGVPIGYVDFQIATWDAAPGSGPAYFSGANNLSTNVVNNQAILRGQSNVLPLTLLPVVNSIALELGTSTLTSGTAATETLTMLAKDAQGNIIVGADGFVNSGGNPMTINLAASDPASAVSLSVLQFTSAAANTSTVTYTGAAENTGCKCASFTATPSLAIAGSNLGAGIAFTNTGAGGVGVPGVPQITSSISLTGVPTSIASGPNNTLWVTENNGYIARITVGPPVALAKEFKAADGVAGMPTGIVYGADGDLWYYDSANEKIAKFRPSTSEVNATESAVIGTVHLPLALGPDGHIWFGVPDNLDSIDPQTMSVTQYGHPDAPAHDIEAVTNGILLDGTDPSVCYAEADWWTIVCYNTVTHSTVQTNIDGPAVALQAGLNGFLYAVVNRSYTPYGNAEEFADGGSYLTFSYSFQMTDANAVFTGLATGTDGNIWFTTEGGSATFGYIDTCACKLLEFGSQSAVPSGALPGQIVWGPDRRPYFLDTVNKSVDRIGQ